MICMYFRGRLSDMTFCNLFVLFLRGDKNATVPASPIPAKITPPDGSSAFSKLMRSGTKGFC